MLAAATRCGIKVIHQNVVMGTCRFLIVENLAARLARTRRTSLRSGLGCHMYTCATFIAAVACVGNAGVYYEILHRQVAISDRRSMEI